MSTDWNRASAPPARWERTTKAVRFAVLGPVRAWCEGQELDLGSPQQRAVLAALLLREGHLVSTEQLIYGIWGSNPPLAAVSTVRTYVSRLRRILEPDRSGGGRNQVVVSVGGGYAIPKTEITLDVTKFEELAADGKRLNKEGMLPEAAKALTSALEMWRGNPLEGVPGPFADVERTRLMERHMSVLEARLDLDLRLGNHDDIVAELTALCAEYPLRERLRALLMLALYRCGRQSEALGVYQDARRVLVSELGVEPGNELRELHSQVLTSDPQLAIPEPVDQEQQAARARTSTPAPGINRHAPQHQLPPQLSVFAGRREQLDEADRLVAAAGGRAGPTIGLIIGTAGVGKTSFAVHWAHRVAADFPDGKLYLDLRGFSADDAPKSPSEAVSVLLQSLGVPAQQLPEHAEAQLAMYRSIIAERRMLLLLDNARDAQQVRPLLAGGPGTLIIVTSRVQLSGLVAADGAHPIYLDVLSEDDSLDMLAQRLGPHRLQAEPEAALDVVDCCARLPLALSIVAARAATRPSFRLEDIAAELRTSRGNLDAFDSGGDPSLNARSVFSWSYSALSEPAAHLFRFLSLHVGSHMSIPSIASLSAVAPSEAHRLLRELCDAALLNEAAPGRYAWHDLLQAYANELCVMTEPAVARTDAQHRLVSFYTINIHSAAEVLNPHRPRIEEPTTFPGVLIKEPAEYAEALSWSFTEHAVLLEVIASAMAAGFYHEVWHLARAMETFLHLTHQSHDRIRTQQLAMAAADKLGNKWMRAHAQHSLSKAYISRDDQDSAHTFAMAALHEFRALGEDYFWSLCKITLGIIAGNQDRHTEAINHYREALAIFAENEDPVAVATILNNTGYEYLRLDQYDQAIKFCTRSLSMWTEIDDRYGQAHSLDSIALAYQKALRHEEAIDAYRKAIELFQGLGAHYFAATCLSQLGEIYLSRGDSKAAHDAWRIALDSMGESDEPQVKSLQDTLRARLTQVSAG
ncbi:AfsR/SARP family transcriptional regulator [Streptomyces flaveolus]|uniref:AfsR/SARP family transcriptional regulator n=1 Tax=Streptomyces flaveolus TaxID=67297 RepID=UPI00340FB68B